MSDGISNAIAAASDYLTQHADEARYTDSMAFAQIEKGLRIRVTGAGGEGLVSDMPAGVGGAGSAPSPGWFFRASVAACVASIAAMRAAQLGIDDFGCTVEVDSESDDRGILGLEESIAAGPLSMRIALSLRGQSADAQTLAEVAKWAIDHCPVSDAVRRAIPVQVEVNV